MDRGHGSSAEKLRSRRDNLAIRDRSIHRIFGSRIARLAFSLRATDSFENEAARWRDDSWCNGSLRTSYCMGIAHQTHPFDGARRRLDGAASVPPTGNGMMGTLLLEACFRKAALVAGVCPH